MPNDTDQAQLQAEVRRLTIANQTLQSQQHPEKLEFHIQKLTEKN